MTPEKERLFLSRIAIGDGCWEWTGSKRPNGYGRFWTGIERPGAHRLSYEMFVGAISDGLQIHHACENKGCVKPSHLRAVTSRENLFASDTPARRNALKTECPQGHPYSAENTMIVARGTQRRCLICHREQTLRNRKRVNT